MALSRIIGYPAGNTDTVDKGDECAPLSITLFTLEVALNYEMKCPVVEMNIYTQFPLFQSNQMYCIPLTDQGLSFTLNIEYTVELPNWKLHSFRKYSLSAYDVSCPLHA